MTTASKSPRGRLSPWLAFAALDADGIALHEALAGCERDGSRDDSRNVALEDFTQSASSIDSGRAARDASKIRRRAKSRLNTPTTARELRRVNESQAKELTRMENVLREQMSSNQLTIESAEITAENARREKEHFEKVAVERRDVVGPARHSGGDGTRSRVER